MDDAQMNEVAATAALCNPGTTINKRTAAQQLLNPQAHV